jgi:chromate transporter
MSADENVRQTHEVQNTRGAVSRWDIFSGFLLIGMFGFGGVAASLFHVIVERRRWLSSEEYAATLALGQVLPGANLINMTTIIGDRFQGLSGALLGLSGLVLVPLVSLVALATLYDKFAYLPDVQSGAAAAAAGAVGLTVGTAIKVGRSALKSPMALVVAFAMFCAIGIFHLPMLPTMLVLVSIAIVGGFWSERT